MKIAVADDHNLVAHGFSELISAELPEASVYTAMDKTELFELLEREEIDILFQDIRFGRYDAREFVKAIKDTFPRLKIVMVSLFSEQDVVNTLFRQGVNGYVSKADAGDEILAAIEAVQRGQAYFSADIRENTLINQTRKPLVVGLTAREKEVLSTIIDGKTIKESAQQLHLSEKTIETYRANLFLKFDVTNMASLVRKAILEGFL